MCEEEIFDNDLTGTYYVIELFLDLYQNLQENIPLEVSRDWLTFEDLETFLLRKLAACADFFFHFANSCRLQNGIR